MRVVVRSSLLIALLAVVVAAAQSQPAPGGGYNLLNFGKGTPAPTAGGVDVIVTNKPTPGYKCTEITIRVVRASDGQTLDKFTASNPGMTVNKSFNGLANNLKVRVAVEATFQNGNWFDFKDIEAFITTK